MTQSTMKTNITTQLESEYELKPEYHIDFLIRGRVVTGDEIGYMIIPGRHGAEFYAPNYHKLSQEIALDDPTKVSEINDLTVEERIEFALKLGQRLILHTNEYLQDAYALGKRVSGLTAPVLKGSYEWLPMLFSKEALWDTVSEIGHQFLDGWVTQKFRNGLTANIRAVPKRFLHIIAGNVPLVAGGTIARAIVLGGDHIIKLPSNDPLTAWAIVKTMIDLDPTSPITRHFSVGYWRGGDKLFEDLIYQPSCLDKIVAWGGMASVRHIREYLRPGLDLVPFDPKTSMSIIDLKDPRLLNPELAYGVAFSLATDAFSWNQNACVNSKIAAVRCDPNNPDDMENLRLFAELVHESSKRLPEEISTAPKGRNVALQAKIDGLMFSPFHTVVGDPDVSQVIISELEKEVVDFSDELCNRVLNIVPFKNINEILEIIDDSRQTVGVFPPTLRNELRDSLSQRGVQRVVDLGAAAKGWMGPPHDGMRVMSRMATWVAEEVYETSMTIVLK